MISKNSKFAPKTIFIIATSAFLCLGCGQKGALYLPPSNKSLNKKVTTDKTKTKPAITPSNTAPLPSSANELPDSGLN